MNSKFIWLIGENEGRTHNNNSYYYWKHIVEKDDNVEKYFVMEKNKNNKEFYKSLPNNLKKLILWRNSLKHYKMYFSSDMFFVTLSYLDVVPNKFLGKKIILKVKKTTIYLQHGITAIKQLGYTGQSYNNNMFRFCYYNPLIKNDLIKCNKFKDYQLFYAEYFPRYIELLKKEEKYNDKNQILWFMTWREYFGDNIDTKIFIKKIKQVVFSKELLKYLTEKNIVLKICVHSFFKDKFLNEVIDEINHLNSNFIKFVSQNEVDVMDELASSKLLITDYSSVGFDFAFLNKPVILFQPDLDSYLKKRKTYCSIDELNEFNITDSKDLINSILSEDYAVNDFFKKRLPKKINYNYIKQGKHIDRIYDYFYNIQNNKITFIGYNFYGVGGTVNATRALAEGLLEKGYLVELLSLKRAEKSQNMPCALNLNYLFFKKTKSLKEKLLRNIHNFKRNFSYLKYDYNMNLLHPYCGYQLTKLMKNIKTKTLISTRESLHLFLNDCTSPFVKNKIYFFHCLADVMDSVFPGAMEQIKKTRIPKAVFVTEQNRIAIEKKYNYNNYEKFLISGNTLESYKIIDKSQIRKIKKKKVYLGIYLVRVNRDRIDDLQNLINYGKYLKENNINNLVIDVFGGGDYVDEFLNELVDNDLYDIIRYKGVTQNVRGELNKHDVMIDFSINHSFGMTYIEAILNGKKVFCMKNPGSLEVMNNIPNSYIESYEDLTENINKLYKTTKKELVNNYEEIEKKYSRKVVTEKFIEFINDDN